MGLPVPGPYRGGLGRGSLPAGGGSVSSGVPFALPWARPFSAASLLKISWLQGAVAAAILVPRHLGKEHRKAAEARKPRKDQPRTHKGREQV